MTVHDQNYMDDSSMSSTRHNNELSAPSKDNNESLFSLDVNSQRPTINQNDIDSQTYLDSMKKCISELDIIN